MFKRGKRVMEARGIARVRGRVPNARRTELERVRSEVLTSGERRRQGVGRASEEGARRTEEVFDFGFFVEDDFGMGLAAMAEGGGDVL